MGDFIELTDYTDRSYLNYAMYVVHERALPHIADGMKPVQRRIVYAMHQLGLTHNAKPKKSARTIGDVLGKYHPHGDAACYDAMVRMAQPFSLRYPLIDGQGNWGSQDNPDSYAAMRYTEARLSHYAPLLLRDLPYESVSTKANFDATMQEPELLPAEIPYALINGASGVAVGMACDILPHNMTEVINALVEVIDDPSAGLDAVMQHIKGPDFATTAQIISSAQQLRDIYATGYGQVKARGRYEVDGRDIVITDLPMTVSGESTIAKIAETVRDHKITAVDDILDASDRQTPVRIIVRLKKSAADQAEKVMGFLFRHTDLEKSFKFNMNMIGMDELPEVKNLVEVLHEWLNFRVETVRRRSQYQLGKVNDKLHVTEGLLTAFLNLDEVIRIIRSEDKPKQPLMEALGLTDTQAQAVLDTRLGNLARLEEMELKRRHEELTNEKQRLETLLSDEANLKAAIRQELLTIRDEYGDERRSPVAEPEALPEQEVSAKDLAPSEPVRVVLSRNGYLRAGKGHSLDVTSLQYKSNDGLLDFCDTETSREVTLLDNHGRVYCVSAGGLPSAKSYGEPVTKWLAPASGVEWVALLDPQMAQSWLMVGGEGYGFIATPGAFETRQRKGKAMLTADKAGVPYPPRAISVNDDVAVLTSLGRLLVMPASDLPELDKGKGVKLANLRSGETLVDVAVVSVSPGHGLEVRDGDKALARLSHEDVGLYRNKRAAAPKQVAELKNRSFERLCVVTGDQ